MPKLAGVNRKKIKDGGGGRAAAEVEAAAAAAAKQQKKKAAKQRSNKGTSKQQLSAAQLFERAQQAIAFERYEAALECLRDACELEPDNVEYVDATGALLAELGQEEEAVKALQRAVQLSPEQGFEKYMYLGQLLDGEAGLAAAQRGVEVLQQTVNSLQESGSGDSREAQQLSKQLAAALCSLAEMKMGSAQDVSAVCEEAEALLQRARGVDPASPEPLQALASLRYEQGQAEEALQLLRQSMALWFKPQGSGSEEEEDDDESDGGRGMQEDAAGAQGGAEAGCDDEEFRIPKKPVTMSEEEMVEGEDGTPGSEGSWEDAEEDEDEDDGLPSYEFRFECAKMLLELEDTTETAIQVLEDLLAEQDGVLDVWHLLGLSYYSGGMLEEAAEVCKAGMQLMQQQQVGPDEGIALAFADLHSAIQEAQQAAAAAAGDS